MVVFDVEGGVRSLSVPDASVLINSQPAALSRRSSTTSNNNDAQIPNVQEQLPSRRASQPALPTDPDERASTIAARGSQRNSRLNQLHERHLQRMVDSS